MPRLKPRRREHSLSLRDELAARGAYARCVNTHSSAAGWSTSGDVRPLEHPAVTVAPEHFVVVLRAERVFDEEVNLDAA
jgi:hypothetical protein